MKSTIKLLLFISIMWSGPFMVYGGDKQLPLKGLETSDETTAHKVQQIEEILKQMEMLFYNTSMSNFELSLLFRVDMDKTFQYNDNVLSKMYSFLQDPTAIDFLIKNYGYHTDLIIRLKVIALLQRMKQQSNPVVISYLTKLGVEDPEPLVRRGSVQVLGFVEPKIDIMNHFIHVLKADSEIRVQKEAGKVLARIADKSPQLIPLQALPLLISALQKSDVAPVSVQLEFVTIIDQIIKAKPELVTSDVVTTLIDNLSVKKESAQLGFSFGNSIHSWRGVIAKVLHAMALVVPDETELYRITEVLNKIGHDSYNPIQKQAKQALDDIVDKRYQHYTNKCRIALLKNSHLP